MKEIKLSKSVRAHGDELYVLELREPTGKDVRELGFPYTASGDAGVKMDAGVIAKYISRLAGVPPSSVDEMQPSDLNTISWEIVGFFLGSSAPDNS
ncbi:MULTISPECIES: phage tail assembly protein [Citrobacter]|uniref:Phage tail assembly protein n=1 Tax=Salmonella enterica TaxID=28901 RepID=A0A622CXD1_SALER|nr:MULTISPECIES: phage tail assembly protein [Citrobacter]EAR6367439.1 phage tail assembly protein [Salmonella enterica subsp. enterica serovar Alachua]EDT2447380.1 phage tail assembly protein [Salmonella enterica subsp. enterica]EHJ8970095.1 phage tail assembly protein [Salmonella enterica]ECY8988043.1 phage tail assembly protein [Salmonella enterica subsp. enterica serovar Alachua]EDU0983600.1 phage tail assembly protein [Salmonella enterica subsp. enterica]